MPPVLSRTTFDFLAENYKQAEPRVTILPPTTDYRQLRAQPAHNASFVQRWYLSLQGEQQPLISSMAVAPDGSNQKIYRYDWAFGMTLIKGFWWDWMAELSKESALAVHIVLETTSDATEVVPVAATLNALHPSRNTRSIWELARPIIPKAAAEMAKLGGRAVPTLEYLATGLLAASNVVESHSANQTNWFLY